MYPINKIKKAFGKGEFGQFEPRVKTQVKHCSDIETVTGEIGVETVYQETNHQFANLLQASV